MFTAREYVKAKSLDEAWELNQIRSNRVVGGMLWLKMSRLNINKLIDLSDLGLDDIEENEDEFIIGCMTPLRELELHPGLERYSCGAVREALRSIVGVQFRNLATVGGGIYGRYGFSDVLTVFAAMDSFVELHKGGIIPLSEFIGMKPDRDILVRLIIKKTALSNFDTSRKAGLIAMNLKDDDQLIDIKQTTGNNNVIIVTKHGKCISFSEEDVRPMGRIAGGVRAIKLEGGDEVVSMELVEPGQELLVVTEKGYGKRTKVEEYKIQVRGGKGLLTYDKAKFKKTGQLVGAIVVDDDDDVMLINSNGIIIRMQAREISRLGRATQGVKIMNVGDDVNIIAIAKVAREEDADDGPSDEEQIEIK